jgi:hypothetical protein
MATMAIPFLLESALVEAIKDFFAVSGLGSCEVTDALGTALVTFPAVRVEVTGASEEPENSGNFKCAVDLIAYGQIDPDEGWDYTNVHAQHSTTCGGLHEFITQEVSLSDLEANPHSATNNLKAYELRYSGFSRSIDVSAGAFEDTFSVEVYLRESA